LRDRRRTGLTIIELVVSVAIVGIMAGITTVSFTRWQQDQTLATATRQVSDMVSYARSEAIRTGNLHIVYLSAGVGTDVAGNPPLDRGGRPVPLLILNDGRVGSPGQNCVIDAGEPFHTMPMVQGLAWGFTQSGGLKAPLDMTAPGNATGSSFSTPAGNPLNAIAFGADGVPISFDVACNLGMFGTGNGGIYLTNGSRDYAVVVLPLGAIRMHGWETSQGAWKL